MPTLNEKVCELEKTLLAIDAICSIAEEHAPQTNDTLGHCACVASHLMEQAMLQVEALRVAISAMPADVLPVDERAAA
jgi:hypothetical protein